MQSSMQPVLRHRLQLLPLAQRLVRMQRPAVVTAGQQVLLSGRQPALKQGQLLLLLPHIPVPPQRLSLAGRREVVGTPRLPESLRLTCLPSSSRCSSRLMRLPGCKPRLR